MRNFVSKFKNGLLSALAVGALVVSSSVVGANIAMAAPTPESMFEITPEGVISLSAAGEAHFENETVLEVPATVNSVTVTSVKASAFKNKKLTNVTLPATVTSIGEWAFYGNAITEFNATGVVSLAPHALQLNKLTSFNFDNVQFVSEAALAGNEIASVDFTNAPLTKLEKDALRDNKIATITSLGNVEEIGENAFLNNVITSPTEIDMSKVKRVGDRAFDGNRITQVKASNEVESWGAEVFANNETWVKIVSTSDNVTTQDYASGFGQVVNPITINVKFRNQANGQDILAGKVLGNDLSKGAYSVGVPATVKATVIDGYIPVNEVVSFTPDRDGYEVVINYTEVEKTGPTITFSGPLKSYPKGSVVTDEMLKEGVTATAADGQDVTASLVVSPSPFVTDLEGARKVFFTATDANGVSSTASQTVYVGANFGEIETCNGWQVKDFRYEGTVVIGFSASGLAKLNEGNTEVCFPEKNMNGETVTKIIKKNNETAAVAGYNKVTKVESWGSATQIGEKEQVSGSANYAPFISSTALTEISNWGNVTTLGTHIFNGATGELKIPSSWGNMIELGRNAFSNAKIEGGKLPESWGSITSIGFGAFENAALTSIPSEMGSITVIPSFAFSGNKLEAFPNFDGVTEIGISAFYGNGTKVENLSFGTVTKIGYAAFQRNEIQSIGSFGSVLEIGEGAFQYNKISSIPLGENNLTKIGNSAFASNNIERIFTDWSKIELPNRDTTSNSGGASGQKLSVFHGNPVQCTSVKVTSDKVPNIKNLFSNDYYNNCYLYVESTPTGGNSGHPKVLVNRVTVSIKSVSETGIPLGSPKYVTVSRGGNYYPKPIVGYLTPDPIFISNDTVNNQQITVTYERSNIPSVDFSFGYGQGFQDGHIHSTTYSTELSINNTGASAANIPEDSYIVIDRGRTAFNSVAEIYDYSYSSYIKEVRNEGEKTIFVLNEIPVGTSTTIRFAVGNADSANPYTDYDVFAQMFTDQGVPISPEEMDYFRWSAQFFSFNKTVQGKETVVITDHDARPLDLSVVSEGKNYVDYELLAEYKARICDTLPSYRDVSGVSRVATFISDENPGWYRSGNEICTTNKTNRANLRLRYPDAPNGTEITNTAVAKVGNEDDFTGLTGSHVYSTARHTFQKIIRPKGIFAKYATGPQYDDQKERHYFVDNVRGRNELQTWQLIVDTNDGDYAKAPIINPVITDRDLDGRLRYYSLTATSPEWYGASANLINSEGATVWSVNLSSDEKVIPENVRNSGHKLTISKTGTIPLKRNTNILLKTELRDKENTAFDNLVPNNNVFRNFADFEADNVAHVDDEDFIVVEGSKDTLKAFKNGLPGAVSNNSDLIYDIGFTMDEKFGKNIENFKQIDLLPNNVTVTDYSMSDKFASIPGAKVDLVKNYNNTGRDAIVYSAAYMDAKLVGHTAFTVGKVKVKVDSPLSDTVKNDTYIEVGNTDIQLEGTVINNSISSKPVSYATISNHVLISDELSTAKRIRHIGQPWQFEIVNYPNEKFDYLLRVVNGLQEPRTGGVIYDTLPYVGDKTILNTNRGSQFSNTWDVSRQPVIPAGWSIKYSTQIPNITDHSKAGITQAYEALTWSDTPSADVKSIKLVNESGTLAGKTLVDFELPMVAPADVAASFNAYMTAPNKWGHKAANTFAYADDQTTLMLEPNFVYNRLGAMPVNVEFKKVDDAGLALQGAIFGLYEDGKLIASASSDSQGNVKFRNVQIKPSMTVSEMKAPNGYTKSNNVVTITTNMLQGLTPDSNVLNLTNFINNKIPTPKIGNVEFLKVGEGDVPLPGAKFRLSNSTLSVEAFSNVEGKVSFLNVPLGSYTLSEVTPPGHLFGNFSTQVNLTNENETVTVNGGKVPNTIGRLKFAKLGVTDMSKEFGTYKISDGVTLTGATFNLYEGEGTGGNLLQTINTRTVPAYTQNLTVGQVYTLVETNAPSGYTLDTTPRSFKILPNGKVANVAGEPFAVQEMLFMPNEKATGASQVTVMKRNALAQRLDGAEFTLYRTDSGSDVFVSSQVTVNGNATFNTVLGGSYKLVETKAPKGYSSDNWSESFIADPHNPKTFSFNVVDPKLNMEILKFEPIAEGLSEIQANEMVNDLGYGKVIKSEGIFKVVKPLANATFDIVEHDTGTTVESVVSGPDGVAKLTASLYEETKTYRVTETVAPDGYKQATAPVLFRPKDQTQLANFDGVVTVEFENVPYTGRLAISKVDSGTGKFLPNAKFEVSDGKGFSKTVTTSTSGIAVLSKLPYGNYTVTEVEAPVGYLIDSTPKSVTVDGTNAAVTLTVKNTPATTSFKFVKTNSLNVALEGVEFELVKDCSGVADCQPYSQSFRSGANGEVNVTDVEINRTYWLTETKAKEGYMLLAKPVKVVIDSDGVVASSDEINTVFNVDTATLNGAAFKIVNYTKGLMPNTGYSGAGSGLFAIAGVTVALAGLAFFGANRFRKES